MVDAFREIEELVEFQGRWPGTDSERRAANHLARRLTALGRDAQVEPATIWPRYHLTHLIHALLAIAGSVVAVASPVAGLVVVAAALLATIADVAAPFPLVRRITGRRASQNVTSRERTSRPGTLILTAHYDAAKGGAIFGGWSARLAALGARFGRPLGPFQPFVWAQVVLLGCMVARVLGSEGNVVSAVQFVPTVLLIVSVPLLADIALSAVVPGANDNASGVATVLRLAERYGGKLDSFDVWVVFPGAQEAMSLGMRAWMKRHRKELDPTATVVLNVDAVGAGTVRWFTRDGSLLAYKFHPRLVELCERIAEEDEDDLYGARGMVSRSSSDARVARTAGLPAITISCRGAFDRVPNHHQPTDTVDLIDEEALDRAFAFCSELIELVDEEVGPLLEEDEYEDDEPGDDRELEDDLDDELEDARR